MRSFNPIRFFRALARRRSAAAPVVRRPLPAALCPSIYADAPLSRVLVAIERRASDLELALAEYVRARRAAGVLPEAVLVEFKRVLRRAAGLDGDKPRLTGRLIELYFAA
jgi:hypothetical protein